MNKRILFIQDGEIKDFGVALNNYKSGSKLFPFTIGGFLYIGSKLPFNHLYLKLKKANTALAGMKIQYWGDTDWRDVSELIDETNGLQNSGFINFTPDIDSRWTLQCKSQEIPALSDIIIYNQYWMRVSFTIDLDADTELQWLGNLFSTDDDLYGEFPDLAREKVLTGFSPGKTSWEEQAVRAAELIEQDLINGNVVDGSENILERSVYKNASVSKTAELAMVPFGDDYLDDRKAARDDYKSRLVRRLPRVDLNEDAVETVTESKWQTGFMSR